MEIEEKKIEEIKIIKYDDKENGLTDDELKKVSAFAFNLLINIGLDSKNVKFIEWMKKIKIYGKDNCYDCYEYLQKKIDSLFEDLKKDEEIDKKKRNEILNFKKINISRKKFSEITKIPPENSKEANYYLDFQNKIYYTISN